MLPEASIVPSTFIAVPEEALGETLDASADPPTSRSSGGAAEPTASEQAWSFGFFFATRSLPPMRKAVLLFYATALKASSVADFYMTKYQSKAQQAFEVERKLNSEQLKELKAKAKVAAAVAASVPRAGAQ